MPLNAFEQAAETPIAKNTIEFPTGNFTALPYNDSGTGADGRVYDIPNVDALVITLPNKADMNAAEGIWRVKIFGDWEGLSQQPTRFTFQDDATNNVDLGGGLPDGGTDYLDLVFDLAGDQWKAVSGGDTKLSQVIPTYTVHTEVPTAVRLWLIDGTGASAQGLYRAETGTNSPNYIG